MISQLSSKPWRPSPGAPEPRHSPETALRQRASLVGAPVGESPGAHEGWTFSGLGNEAWANGGLTWFTLW